MRQGCSVFGCIVFGEYLTFQPLAVIEIADQGALGSGRRPMNALVVLPEDEDVDRPGIVGVFGHALSDAWRKLIESVPRIALVMAPYLMAQRAFVRSVVGSHAALLLQDGGVAPNAAGAVQQGERYNITYRGQEPDTDSSA